MPGKDRPDWYQQISIAMQEVNLAVANPVIYSTWTGLTGNTGDDDTATGFKWCRWTNVGKWIPHGVRGSIKDFRIYAKNTGTTDETITIAVAPYPGAGKIKSFTTTIPAGQKGWFTFIITSTEGYWWNYDGIFVYVESIGPNTYYGVDNQEKRDMFNTYGWQYYGTLDGVTDYWRVYIKVFLVGQTAGDVQVTGLVNIIPIPSVVAEAIQNEGGTVPAGQDLVLYEMKGMGEVLFLHFYTAHDYMTVFVRADGVDATPRFTIMDWYTRGYDANTFGIKITRYTAAGACDVIMEIRVPFRRKLQLVSHNYDTADHYARVWGTVALIK